MLCWPLQANMEKTAFILSYLSSKGRIPLLGLNDIISTILQKENPKQTSWLLMQCFYQSRLASNPNTGKWNTSHISHSVALLSNRKSWVLHCIFDQCYPIFVISGVPKRMEWLLELMGHIRKVLYGAPTVQCDNAKEVNVILSTSRVKALVKLCYWSSPLNLIQIA